MTRIAVLLLSLSFAGCGVELRGKIACTDEASCTTPDAAALSARCCGGYCVIEAVGCESGLRYLTTEPAVGTCVAQDVCAVERDLAAPSPADFSFPSHD